VHLTIQQYFRRSACRNYDFGNVTSLTDTPKVNVSELEVLLKREDSKNILKKDSKYVRIKFKKRHFINVTI
jgi:hypothetical protein